MEIYSAHGFCHFAVHHNGTSDSFDGVGSKADVAGRGCGFCRLVAANHIRLRGTVGKDGKLCSSIHSRIGGVVHSEGNGDFLNDGSYSNVQETAAVHMPPDNNVRRRLYAADNCRISVKHFLK